MRRFGGAADEPGAAVADGAERERHGVRVRPRGRVIGLAVAIVAVTVTATAYALTHGAPAGRPAAASAQHAALAGQAAGTGPRRELGPGPGGGVAIPPAAGAGREAADPQRSLAGFPERPGASRL